MYIRPMAILLAACIMGCATTTPDLIPSNRPDPDPSTPVQYLKTVTEFNGGFLGFYTDTQGKRRGILTINGRDKYNTLIEKYRLQFQEVNNVTLSPDLGIEEYVDRYNNKLFSIDKTRLKYFMMLSQWARDERDGDSTWLKIKSKILP